MDTSDTIIKLVRTYRFTTGLPERLRLAEQLFKIIEPQLRMFVYGKITGEAAKDVLQEVLVGVAKSLGKFQGNTVSEFWGWCYTIARFKLMDQFRGQYADRLQPVAPEELSRMMDVSAQVAPITAEIRADLQHAMSLLSRSKPECYDYLWKRYVYDLDYSVIAAEYSLTPDAVRMKVGRCLEEAKKLVS